MSENSTPTSLRQIARRAGVSVATVSLALKNHKRISAATRERIQQLAREMGYQPSLAISKAMSSARTRGRKAFRETLACICGKRQLDECAAAPRNSSELQSRAFHQGIQQRAEELSCAVNYLSAAKTPLPELLRIFRARGIERVIIAAHTMDYELLQQLSVLWREFPCVSLGVRDIYWVGGTVVRVDFFAAGRRAFYRAWRAGYRRFYIHSSVHQLNADRRFEAGFRFAASYLAPQAEISINRSGDLHFHPDSSGIGPADCVIGGLDYVRYPEMLRKMRKTGFAWLDWHANLHTHLHPVTGIDQRDQLQGRSAVDLVLAGNRDSAPPRENPTATATAVETHLIEPGWLDGNTLSSLRNDHLNFVADTDFPILPGENRQPVDLGACPGLPLVSLESWTGLLRIPPVPAGKWTFHGIPFHFSGIRPEQDAAGTCCLGISSFWSVPVVRQAAIPLAQKARCLYIMHASAHARQPGQIAAYHLVYRDGQRRTLPVLTLGEPAQCADPPSKELQSHAIVQDWFPDIPQFQNALAHPVCLLDSENALGQTGYYYVVRWENPRPGEMIDRLELQLERTTDGKALLMFAGLTLGH